MEKENKTTYVNKLKETIELRRVISQFFLGIFFHTLKDFNGKVCNKRFANTLSSKLGDFLRTYPNPNKFNGYVSSEYNKWAETEKVQICVWNVLKPTIKAQLIVDVYLDGETKRIVYDKTIETWNNGNNPHNYFDNYTKLCENVVNDYDKYMETAQQLKELVDKFNHLPTPFRANIEKLYVTPIL